VCYSVLQLCFMTEYALMADVRGRVVHMSVLHYVAMRCSVLQCIAVGCCVLQSSFIRECALMTGISSRVVLIKSFV